jgi:hypothetical protein
MDRNPMYLTGKTMTKLAFALGSAAAALLLAGNALAATPAAGEEPFFNSPIGPSAVQREEVRVTSAAQMPGSGEMSSVVAPTEPSTVTRADVLVALQAAIDQGIYPDSGEMSSVAGPTGGRSVSIHAAVKKEAMR